MSSPNRPVPSEVTSPTATSPLSQYPFPDSISRGKQKRNVRRDSYASSVVSIGGVLDSGTISYETIPEFSQNAISSLIQPPFNRAGLQPHGGPSNGFKPPTARDIPPVTLTNIPHIEATAFRPYIKQLGSLYDIFQRARQEDGGEARANTNEKGASKGEEWEAVLSSRGQLPSHSRRGSASSSLPSPLETPMLKRRVSGQRRQHAITALSTIPPVYSEEEFHLENPRTFEIVSEKSEIVRDPNVAATSRKTLATNAILQEKLSWYMDTVEIHLIDSISTASKSFFSALGSLRELHAEAAESVDRIQKLRKDLAKLDKEMAKGGLKVVNMKQRRDNVRMLAQAIIQLEEVALAMKRCGEKVDSGEIDTALDDIDSVELLLHVGKTGADRADRKLARPLQSFENIEALKGAPEDLYQLRHRVGRAFEARFHETLLQDLRRHVSNTGSSLTLQRWGTSFNRQKPGQRRGPSMVPAYMSHNPDFRHDLEAEMKGLSRAKHTLAAATTFRAMFLREMKNMIRKQLPNSNDDDNVSTISASTQGGRQRSQQEKSSLLARNLRAMDAEDSYAMLTNIYTNISEGLRRLSVQVKIVLDITSGINLDGSKPSSRGFEAQSFDKINRTRPSMEQRKSGLSAQAEVQQALDLSSLLGEAVDAVQQQITKVVKVRSQQTVELPLADFLQFFTLHRLFADECEAISGRSGSALKSVVDAQIKDYVVNFGNTQKRALIEVMDADKWDAQDFGDRENDILSRIIQASTADIEAWTETCNIWQSNSELLNHTDGRVQNGTHASGGKDKIRSAVIDEQNFILPVSAMAMLYSTEHFQHLTTGLPSMGADIALSLLESLKMFNSRSSQLILGAGATRSAGLKNITTKHLALSSQALSFIVTLIPHVREFFRRHLSSSSAPQVMGEFDKVKRLLQEHQNGIHEKLVDIMSGRASMHINTMKKTNWEQASANKSVAVSPYMEVLTKETATLQKVLAKHLPEPVVSSIMIPVFASYKEQWSRAYQEVIVNSVAAKERIIADAEYFNSRISKLDGAGDLGEQIVNIVKAKAVVSDAGSLKVATDKKVDVASEPLQSQEQRS